MEDRKVVLQETAVVALGEAICTALMLGAFALLGKLDLGVILGGLMGAVVAVGNFFFMAMVATLASERAVDQDVEGAKKLLKSSQTLRFAALTAVLVVCAASNIFNVLALVLPLVFVRPVLLVAEFLRKKGE